MSACPECGRDDLVREVEALVRNTGHYIGRVSESDYVRTIQRKHPLYVQALALLQAADNETRGWIARRRNAAVQP